MQKNPVYDSLVLLCKIINSVKIKVQHFIFFSVMVITKSYLLSKRLPTVTKQIIFIIKVIIKCRSGILCRFAYLTDSDLLKGFLRQKHKQLPAECPKRPLRALC